MKNNIKKWSNCELEVIKELYPTESNKLIAILLHRSKVSIRKKAQYLGLKKSEDRLRQSKIENAKCKRGVK